MPPRPNPTGSPATRLSVRFAPSGPALPELCGGAGGGRGSRKAWAAGIRQALGPGWGRGRMRVVFTGIAIGMFLASGVLAASSRNVRINSLDEAKAWVAENLSDGWDATAFSADGATVMSFNWRRLEPAGYPIVRTWIRGDTLGPNPPVHHFIGYSELDCATHRSQWLSRTVYFADGRVINGSPTGWEYDIPDTISTDTNEYVCAVAASLKASGPAG